MSVRDLRARLTAAAQAESGAMADSIRLRLAAIDLLGQAEAPAPELRLPADIVRARLTAGVPLLNGVDLSVSAAASRLFERLAGVFLTDPHHEGAATAILSAVQAHQLHVEQVVGEAIVSHADHLAALALVTNVESDLLAVLADLTSRPLLTSVAGRLRPALKLGNWQQSYCPICGARPIFGERQGDLFSVRCGRCTTLWAWTLPACPACKSGQLSPTDAAPSDQEAAVTVLTCAACRNYLKVVEGQEIMSLVDVLLYDLATWTTDRAALLQGWTAPAWQPRRLEHGDPAGEELDDE